MDVAAGLSICKDSSVAGTFDTGTDSPRDFSNHALSISRSCYQSTCSHSRYNLLQVEGYRRETGSRQDRSLHTHPPEQARLKQHIALRQG
jgi:hypothetical protein